MKIGLGFLLVLVTVACFGCGGGPVAQAGPADQNPTTSASLAISQVAAGGVSNNSAVVTWTTNLPSSSQVEYGVTANYGSMTALDSGPVVNHHVTLNG